MTRLMDWLRFRGWRNAYWREDAMASRCEHGSRWIDTDGVAFCVLCGSPIAGIVYQAGSSNTTVTVSGEWPF